MMYAKRCATMMVSSLTASAGIIYHTHNNTSSCDDDDAGHVIKPFLGLFLSQKEREKLESSYVGTHTRRTKLLKKNVLHCTDTWRMDNEKERCWI